MKLFSIITVALLGALSAGCEIGDARSPDAMSNDTYYASGYYDGPYWTYRDRDGKVFHELREDHERREQEYAKSGGDARRPAYADK